MIVIDTFAGDSAPDETLTITRDGGGVVDLTGAKVYLIIQNPITNLPTNNYNAVSGINNACTIVTPTNPAVVTYAWNAGGTDCPEVGIYDANLMIVYPNGAPEHYKVIINAEYPIPGYIVS